MKVGFTIHPFNFVMRNRRKELGLTQAELSELCGIGSQALISKIERLVIPSGKIDTINARLLRIARELDVDFDDLFPQDYLDAIAEDRLPRGKSSFIWVKEYSLEMLPAPGPALAITADVDANLNREYILEKLDEMISRLSDREREVINLRFGLDGGDGMTLEKVGEAFGVTGNRIRQIEAKALRKMRHPHTSGELKEFVFGGKWSPQKEEDPILPYPWKTGVWAKSKNTLVCEAVNVESGESRMLKVDLR